MEPDSYIEEVEQLLTELEGFAGTIQERQSIEDRLVELAETIFCIVNDC